MNDLGVNVPSRRVLILLLASVAGGCVDLSNPTVTQSDAAVTNDAPVTRDGPVDRPEGEVRPTDTSGSPDRQVPPDMAEPDRRPDPDGPPPSEPAPLKSNGSPCDTGGECVSGICEQRTCCDLACGGPCKACNLSGSLGRCLNVPAGQDPLEQCPDEGAASCGKQGTCNGSGACDLYRSGVVCAAAACTPAGHQASKSCNGTGACQGPAPVNCGKYRCVASGCPATCASTADCVPPNVCSANRCGGLKGEYFNSIDFTNLVLTRVDPLINFSWPDGSPPGVGSPDPGIGGETFSIRWTGQVTPALTGEFTFFALSDDRVRVSVNGTQIINDFVDHQAREVSGRITLVAGQVYSLLVEFAENTEAAEIRLSWSHPLLAKEVIPARVLTPAP